MGSGVKFSLLLPAFILALCFLEMAFGNLLHFRVVWLFYAYVIYFIFFRSFKASLSVNKVYILPYLFLVLGYLLAALLSDNFYNTIKGEMFNILWWTIFSLLVVSELNKEAKVVFFFNRLSLMIFTGSLVAAIIGLYKLYIFEFSGTIWETSYSQEGTIIQGSSLNSDYNIYTLGILLGVFAGKYSNDLYPTKIKNLVFKLSTPVMALAMLTSGSRRGILFTILMLLIVYLFKFSSQISIVRQLATQKVKTLTFCCLFILLFILFVDNIEFILNNLQLESTIFGRLATLSSQLTQANERTLRWDLAYEMLSSKDLVQLIFGSGFDYISRYGEKFGNTEDNPHNFILATWLYGGFCAVLMLFITLITSLRCMANKPIFTFFFIAQLFLLFFSLTSSNTLFSYRIFPVLTLLPLLISTKYSRYPYKDLSEIMRYSVLSKGHIVKIPSSK